MPFSSRSYVNRYVPSNRFPVGLKWLLIVNVAIFLLQYVLSASDFVAYLRNLALMPAKVVGSFAVWQLVTYMFLHAGPSHILWNMLSLWLFGAELERLWGTRKFLRFYFFCGVFAAVAVVLAAYLFHSTGVTIVGSSGAVFGILMAYALMFPDRTILFGFLIPLKTKWFVMIVGTVVVLQYYGSIAVMTYLGGLLAGYLFLRGRRLQTQIRQPIALGYKDWKLRRAKKKFELYLRKENPKRGPWVH